VLLPSLLLLCDLSGMKKVMRAVLRVEWDALRAESIHIDRSVASLDLDPNSTCNVHASELWCGVLVACC
jgi:hypothetical protein